MVLIPFKKHPVPYLRIPEGISATLVKGFASENVAKFLDICEPKIKSSSPQGVTC
jgi:hypothetical protein